MKTLSSLVLADLGLHAFRGTIVATSKSSDMASLLNKRPCLFLLESFAKQWTEKHATNWTRDAEQLITCALSMHSCHAHCTQSWILGCKQKGLWMGVKQIHNCVISCILPKAIKNERNNVKNSQLCMWHDRLVYINIIIRCTSGYGRSLSSIHCANSGHFSENLLRTLVHYRWFSIWCKASHTSLRSLFWVNLGVGLNMNEHMVSWTTMCMVLLSSSVKRSGG